jgi:hypothetical protein
MTIQTISGGNFGVFDSEGRLVDGGYHMSPADRKRAMETTREKLDRIEEKLDRLLASVDTHAERQDRNGLGPEDG